MQRLNGGVQVKVTGNGGGSPASARNAMEEERGDRYTVYEVAKGLEL